MHWAIFHACLGLFFDLAAIRRTAYWAKNSKNVQKLQMHFKKLSFVHLLACTMQGFFTMVKKRKLLKIFGSFGPMCGVIVEGSIFTASRHD